MFSHERVRLVGGLLICVRCIWCGRYCWHFSCLFVRMSVWSMALICMSLVVCWLFLKWYVDSREVLCFTSTFI